MKQEDSPVMRIRIVSGFMHGFKYCCDIKLLLFIFAGNIVFHKIMNKDKNIPRHVAIIMDGNGRWARKKGLDRLRGHYEGVVSVREVIQASLDIGVEYLTIYAFSSENWGRPKSEVEGLMELFCKTIALEIPSLVEKNVRVVFIGEREGLGAEVLKSIDLCERTTRDNTALTLSVALNYGSRQEIVAAVKRITEAVSRGELTVDRISESVVADHLFTRNVPDPDLLIRTSGEHRLSNFLMWQLSYTEFYFTETLWPDFHREAFLDAINYYKTRSRRYGLVTE